MRLRITVEGKQYDVDVEVLEQSPDTQAGQTAPPPPERPAATSASAGESVEVTAPVAGSVFDVKVKTGDQVQAHDTLLVLEAMKMESNVPAPSAGTVKEIRASAGDSVTAGQVLVRLE